jgi:hypothetical protein
MYLETCLESCLESCSGRSAMCSEMQTNRRLAQELDPRGIYPTSKIEEESRCPFQSFGKQLRALSVSEFQCPRKPPKFISNSCAAPSKISRRGRHSFNSPSSHEIVKTRKDGRSSLLAANYRMVSRDWRQSEAAGRPETAARRARCITPRHLPSLIFCARANALLPIEPAEERAGCAPIRALGVYGPARRALALILSAVRSRPRRLALSQRASAVWSRTA